MQQYGTIDLPSTTFNTQIYFNISEPDRQKRSINTRVNNIKFLGSVRPQQLRN